MKSLLKYINENADAAEKPKKKFLVTIKDADGNEQQKTAMAYNIGDIKAYWASGARPDETFVKAIHQDDNDGGDKDDHDADKDDGDIPDDSDSISDDTNHDDNADDNADDNDDNDDDNADDNDDTIGSIHKKDKSSVIKESRAPIRYRLKMFPQ
jgi:hypothetical protein